MPKWAAEREFLGFLPVTYRLGRVLNLLIVVINAILGLFALAGGLEGVLGADRPGRGIALWIVPLLVGLALIAGACMCYECAIRRPRPAVKNLRSTFEGPPGIAIPIHRRPEIWVVLVFLNVSAALGVGCFAAAGGWRVVCAILAPACALPAGQMLRRLPLSHRLVLTVDGVCVQDTMQSAYLAWDDINTLTWTPGPRMDEVYEIVGDPGAPTWWTERRALIHQPEQVRVQIPTMCLDLDPLLLGWALMTYHRYPHLRSELANGVARQRLLDSQFAQFSTPVDVVMMQPFPSYRPRW